MAGLAARDGKVVVVTGDEFLNFDVATGAPAGTIKHPAKIDFLAARAQGDLWLVSGDSAEKPTLRVWDFDGKERWSSKGSHGMLISPALGNDGRLYAIDADADADAIIVFAPRL